MSELIGIIDLSSIRPNREAFKSIDKTDELDRYNRNWSAHRDIYEFYYECLADFIETHLKDNIGQHIKKRFIVYFSARSSNSLKAQEVFEARKEDVEQYGKNFELLDFIHGNQSLFLKIGALWNNKASIVRIISKEIWFVSKDLIDTFESCFEKNSKIFISSWYEDYSELISKDFMNILPLLDVSQINVFFNEIQKNNCI